MTNPATGETTMSITPINATVDNATCSHFFFTESGSWGSETDKLKIRGASTTTT